MGRSKPDPLGQGALTKDTGIMKIGQHDYEEFIDIIKSFHGNLAPGIVMGGFMVDLAYRHLPEDGVFDAVAETSACLPDVIQLLTPCTIGNGWLKIVNTGRYAITMYDKYNGIGVRISPDSEKLKNWSELEAWYLKLKPKKEQDKALLLQQIKDAGTGIFKVEHVRLDPDFLAEKKKSGIVQCPECSETYRSDAEGLCPFCSGEMPYLATDENKIQYDATMPPVKTVSVEHAAGLKTIHDMTRIIPGKKKGPAFTRGQIITDEDIVLLKKMGKEKIYVVDEHADLSEWVHENEAAVAFAGAMAGEGIKLPEAPPIEGKIDLTAARDGLYVVNTKVLEQFNLVPNVMCSSRHSFTPVRQNEKLAGTRAIPLFLSKANFREAMAVLKNGPIVKVQAMKSAKVGIMVTGTEVYNGMIEDKFIPIITKKVEEYGCRVVKSLIAPDDRKAVCDGVNTLLDAGADFIVTTAGLSVDPDDVTADGLLDAGLTEALHGTPILPGAMTLVGKIGDVRIIGVPAGALFFKATSFDLLFPRMLAGIDITRNDLARMGHGSFCLNCDVCNFPQCFFGK